MGLKFLGQDPNWVNSGADGVKFKKKLKSFLTEQALYSVDWLYKLT